MDTLNVVKEKIRVIPAKRKHRHDIKKVNEQTLPENYPLELWEDILSEHCSFVLMANSLLVGYCCVARNSIMSLSILPKYRGRGYGRLLLNTSLEGLKTKNYKEVSLHVRIDNTVAQNLYKSLGFKNVRIIKSYYVDVDAYLMSKQFS
jgi:ribosomal-protein-alanine N-acetyltransferase